MRERALLSRSVIVGPAKVKKKGDVGRDLSSQVIKEEELGPVDGYSTRFSFKLSNSRKKEKSIKSKDSAAQSILKTSQRYKKSRKGEKILSMQTIGEDDIALKKKKEEEKVSDSSSYGISSDDDGVDA